MKERGHLENLGLDEWIILKLIFKKWDGKSRTGCEPIQEQVADTCEGGNEPSGSMKFWERLD